MITFLDPDASNEECLALLSRWGKDAKGTPGGRPRKGRDEFRADWEREARRLWDGGRGMTQREVAEHISSRARRLVSVMSINRWVHRPD